MKEIPLTQGQVALVDDADYPWISQYNWHARYSKDIRSFYAMRSYREGNGKRGWLDMHRAIMGAKHGEQVDHQDHGTLNNQRYNLRLTTCQGNHMNRRMDKRNTSGFCGVSWHAKNKKWLARIKINGKRINLGYFIDKQDAIAARQAANVKYGFHENHGIKLEPSNLPSKPAVNSCKSRRLSSNNTSGFNGVSWDKSRNKWQTIIFVNGKKVSLGRYSNKEDAVTARQEANIKYGFTI